MAEATDWDSYIRCPACGETDYETTDYPRALNRDGAETEVKCEACGASFRVEMCVAVSYHSSVTPPAPAAARAGEAE